MTNIDSLDRFRRLGEELIEEESKEVDIVLLSEAASLMEQDTSNKMSSGFDIIDECLDGGFREGDFTVVSGIPGEGKTTLARMFTLNFAKEGIPSMWFSHEMTSRELWDSFEKMGADTSLISYVPLELQDDLQWTINHCDKGVEKWGIKAVFIDTLGDLVRSAKSQHEMGNYANYLSQICKDLRAYAVSRKIMVFVVAHAVKNTKSSTNETDNSDIANSNGIPAAATNIFHVWRDKEEMDTSYVKIGKSRRDGRAKGKRFKFTFDENKLIPEGEYAKLKKSWVF